MKLVAKNDNIIIKPTEKSSGTYEGSKIIRPDLGKERPETGIIVSVGPGHYAEGSGVWIPTTFQEGETVMVPKFGASQVDYDGQEYYITKEKEIIAAWEEEEVTHIEEFLGSEDDLHDCTCGRNECDDDYKDINVGGLRLSCGCVGSCKGHNEGELPLEDLPF